MQTGRDSGWVDGTKLTVNIIGNEVGGSTSRIVTGQRVMQCRNDYESAALGVGSSNKILSQFADGKYCVFPVTELKKFPARNVKTFLEHLSAYRKIQHKNVKFKHRIQEQSESKKFGQSLLYLLGIVDVDTSWTP